MTSNLKNVPPNWQKVRFDEITEITTDRVEDPVESGLEYFIGLEHLDTDCIKIKRFGSSKDVCSSKFICKKGDIIFGRRRSYLRKVAITDRDAVVSTDAMVFRPSGDKIYPDFLTCFMQSSIFWRAVHANSEGSMSPRIKWKALAAQEFWLPSIEEQKKISELLWSIEGNIQKTEKLIETTEKLKQGLLNELLTKGIGHNRFKDSELGRIPEEWEVVKLGKILKLIKEKLSAPYLDEKYVALEHIDPEQIIQKNYGSAKKVKSITNVFKKGYILYGKLRPYLNKASIVTFDGICSTEILVLDSKENSSNEFIINHLKNNKFVEYNNYMAFGTKMPRTSFDIISNYKIALPTTAEQKNILYVISSVDNQLLTYKANIENLSNLKKKLINELVSSYQ